MKFINIFPLLLKISPGTIVSEFQASASASGPDRAPASRRREAGTGPGGQSAEEGSVSSALLPLSSRVIHAWA